MEMENYFIKKLKEFNIEYVKIDNSETLIKEKIPSSMRCLAIYYLKIEKNYDLAKKYFLMAVEGNDFFAMNDLAVYYEKIEKNDDLAKKYILMALEKNHPIIIENIIGYYGRNYKDLSFVDLHKYEKKFMKLFDAISKVT